MIALAALVKDLRAAGIPYEPDLTWNPPVRHRSALYVALGHLCNRGEEYGPLGMRVKDALKWVKALGRRSR